MVMRGILLPCLAGVSALFLLSACGVKGKLKTPDQIERDAQKKKDNSPLAMPVNVKEDKKARFKPTPETPASAEQEPVQPEDTSTSSSAAPLPHVPAVSPK